eukprot:1131450-Rhodomonas_salina.1
MGLQQATSSMESLKGCDGKKRAQRAKLVICSRLHAGKCYKCTQLRKAHHRTTSLAVRAEKAASHSHKRK